MSAANFQSRTAHVKAAAKAMNVSERGIWKCIAIRKKRPDLGQQIMAGTMSVDAAYRIVTAKPMPTSRDRLLKAWNNASEADRWWLIEKLAGQS